MEICFNKDMKMHGQTLTYGSFPFLDTFVSKIRENVSRNRRNDKKCLEIGENVFSHF